MAQIDSITGQLKPTLSYPNTFLSVAKDMFSSWEGTVMIFIPLIILVGGFFALKKYTKLSKKGLIIYTVIAVIVYIFLIFYFSRIFLKSYT